MKGIDIITIIKEKKRRRNMLKTEAMGEAKRLTNLLSKKFTFEKLYLFGSVTKEERYYNRNSDIDMVVKDMPRDVYLRAYAFLLRSSRFRIDFKPWEDMTDTIKEYENLSYDVPNGSCTIFEKRRNSF
ncbi:MAG: hypothetical protein SCARUB_03174 [Candidatus Scalindua rubra]|uniref:Nucleotidyltransferase domain protein n=1 Tax=Candidatus Scalindua rubra TaxID=1872076 RepID=A0A1E3X7U1_9BACT|nr:MAG: hypothetical protein SCARUB_03174 [Candidatus Scalindua rubra]